jgi:hypothetical protein
MRMRTQLPKVARRSAVVIVALAALALGYLAWVAPRMSAAGQPQAGAKSAHLKELLQERLTTAREASRLALARFKNGQSFGEIREANLLLVEAELDVCDSAPERVAALEKLRAIAQDTARIAEAFVKVGQGPATTALLAKADLLQIEIALERAKAKGK